MAKIKIIYNPVEIMHGTLIKFVDTQQFIRDSISNKKKQLLWLESKELYEECAIKLQEIKELEILIAQNE